MTTLLHLSKGKENSIVPCGGHGGVVWSPHGGHAMNRLEELRQEALDLGADVIEWDFSSNIKGLYCNGVIALNRHIETSAEESAVLAEEIGHHLTATGSILDPHQRESRKQELKGRAWAYDRLIGLGGIIRAHNAGCQSRYEAADYLGVPEETLQEAVDYYHEKYGLFTQQGNYVVYFEPLGVFELK